MEKTSRMQDKYKNYGYSQLVEMLGMNEEQEKKCMPKMTVKEIREIKKKAKEKRKSSQVEKSDNCDVATVENKSNSVEETTKELSEKEKQGKAKHEVNSISVFNKEMAIKSFVASPANVVLGMFKRRFGDDLKADARGKMLEMEIPGYKVTIRISFKEIEGGEEK